MGGTLLAIGLIVLGLSLVVGFAIPPALVGVWAIITGILLLVGR
jgi:hypothetical protein